MPREILGRMTQYMTLVVPSGQAAGTRVQSTLANNIKPGADFVMRTVDVTANAHNINRLVTVFVGGVAFIDHLPDQQNYGSAPLSKAEDDIVHKQSDIIRVEVEIATGGTPSADATYLIAVEYWIVRPGI